MFNHKTNVPAPCMQSWTEKYQRSDEELNQAITLYTQLANTMLAPSHAKALKAELPTYRFVEDITLAILTKYRKDLIQKIDTIAMYEGNTLENLTALLSQVGFSAKADSKTKRKLCRALTLKEALLVKDFHYCLATHITSYHNDVFYLRNAIYHAIDFFILREHLAQGMNNNKLDAVADELMNKHDASYFTSGHATDLFVYDAMVQDPLPYLSIPNDRLSTYPTKDRNEHKLRLAGGNDETLFSVA